MNLFQTLIPLTALQSARVMTFDEVLILPDCTRAARAQVRKFGTLPDRTANRAKCGKQIDGKAVFHRCSNAWRMDRVYKGQFAVQREARTLME